MNQKPVRFSSIALFLGVLLLMMLLSRAEEERKASAKADVLPAGLTGQLLPPG